MPVTHPLHRLFRPRSIAVVGASQSEQKIGHIVINNIVESGFTGTIFPVNPKLDYFGALRAYPTLKDLPRAPDLAIIAIPAKHVLDAVRQSGEKGIRNVMIFSAGFKESGEEGKQRESQLRSLADTFQLNILGPNCLGFVTAGAGLNATFGDVPRTLGPLQLISQSGAIATSMFDWARSADLGFDSVITLGNKAVIGEHDVLDYLAKTYRLTASKRTALISAGFSGYQPVGLYLESIMDGQSFMRTALGMTKHDPVFVLHPGVSENARTAMQSHTGAIAGADKTISTALAASGVIRCDDAQDLFDLSRYFSWEQAPKGPRVAIVTNAGGPGVLATDAIEREGLELAKIDKATEAQLAKLLPRSAAVHNPVDLLGDAMADRYMNAAKLLLAKRNVDALLVILTPQMMTEIEQTAEYIGTLSRKYRKPVVCSFMGGTRVAEGEAVLSEYHIPSFHFPARAVRVLGKAWWWQSWRRAHKAEPKEKHLNKKTTAAVTKQITEAKSRSASITGNDCGELLKTVGLRVPESGRIASVKEAEAFALPNGYPLVMKLVAPTLLHKSDIGGVWTHLEQREHLDQAYMALDKARTSLPKVVQQSSHIEVQQQINDGIELIIGIKRDPHFGRLLIVGSGGVNAELYDDVATAVMPLGKTSIGTVLERTKVATLLKGYRGESPFAFASLIDLIAKLDQLVASSEDIKEIEINPVIVTKDAAWAVDGKCIFT